MMKHNNCSANKYWPSYYAELPKRKGENYEDHKLKEKIFGSTGCVVGCGNNGNNCVCGYITDFV